MRTRSPNSAKAQLPHRFRTHRGLARANKVRAHAKRRSPLERGVPGHGPQQASMSMAACVDAQRTDCCRPSSGCSFGPLEAIGCFPTHPPTHPLSVVVRSV